MRSSRTNSTEGPIDAFDQSNGCGRVETVGTGRQGKSRPTATQGHARQRKVERAMGIEPTAQAWEAWVLPLYDARCGVDSSRLSEDQATTTIEDAERQKPWGRRGPRIPIPTDSGVTSRVRPNGTPFSIEKCSRKINIRGAINPWLRSPPANPRGKRRPAKTR